LKYYSCEQIENFSLNFHGRVDTGEKFMALCCEPISCVPRIALSETAEESVKAFERMRSEIIEETIKISLSENLVSDEERRYTSGCAKCVRFQLNDWKSEKLISRIILSMYPAPCQCRCIYCNRHSNESGIFKEQFHAEGYEKVFDVIEWARNNDMIASNAIWILTSGEITIHPYRDKIFNLVKGKATIFYTNCFVFDERIMINLAENPKSTIVLSIDCGTKETWYKIKGVNNFYTVMNNLILYSTKSTHPGQIILKYIVLPGINDNLTDFLSVIDIMKTLKISHLSIARNDHLKYWCNEEQREILLTAVGYLMAMLNKNDLTMDLNKYSPSENKMAYSIANDFLKNGVV